MKFGYNILAITLVLSAIAPSTVRANTGAIIAGTAMITGAVMGKYASSKVATAKTKTEKDNYTLLKWLGYGASSVSGCATFYLLVRTRMGNPAAAPNVPNQNVPQPQPAPRRDDAELEVRNIIRQLEEARPGANIREMRRNAYAVIQRVPGVDARFNLAEELIQAFEQAQRRLAQAAPVQLVPAPVPVPAPAPAPVQPRIVRPELAQARAFLPWFMPANLPANVRQQVNDVLNAVENLDNAQPGTDIQAIHAQTVATINQLEQRPEAQRMARVVAGGRDLLAQAFADAQQRLANQAAQGAPAQPAVHVVAEQAAPVPADAAPAANPADDNHQQLAQIAGFDIVEHRRLNDEIEERNHMLARFVLGDQGLDINTIHNEAIERIDRLETLGQASREAAVLLRRRIAESFRLAQRMQVVNQRAAARGIVAIPVEPTAAQAEANPVAPAAPIQSAHDATQQREERNRQALAQPVNQIAQIDANLQRARTEMQERWRQQQQAYQQWQQTFQHQARTQTTPAFARLAAVTAGLNANAEQRQQQLNARLAQIDAERAENNRQAQQDLQEIERQRQAAEAQHEQARALLAQNQAQLGQTVQNIVAAERPWELAPEVHHAMAEVDARNEQARAIMQEMDRTNNAHNNQ